MIAQAGTHPARLAKLSEPMVLTISFPLSGVVTTLLGPLLPVLVLRWALTDAQAGQLFLAQFLASTLGAVCSGWIVARMGAPRSIAASYALMGSAVLATGFVPHLAGLMCIAAYGFSLGVSIPVVNLIAGLRSRGREVAQLNILNMAWCLGAVLAPPAIAFLLRAGGLAVVLASICGLCLLSGAICLIGLSNAEAEEKPVTSARVSGAARRAAVGAGIFLFLYVGVENGLSGWLPVFAQRTVGTRNWTAALALSVFWASILVARSVTASVAPHLRPRPWILRELAVAFLGMSVLVAVDGGPVLLVVATAAAGLGLGPVFPTAVAIFQEKLKAEAAPLIGFVFAAAGCGGGALPWVIGTVSSTSGSLRIGLASTLAAMAAMLIARRWF